MRAHGATTIEPLRRVVGRPPNSGAGAVTSAPLLHTEHGEGLSIAEVPPS